MGDENDTIFISFITPRVGTDPSNKRCGNSSRVYQSITPWKAQVYEGEGSQLTEAIEMQASNSAFCTRNVGKASKGEACVTVLPGQRGCLSRENSHRNVSFPCTRGQFTCTQSFFGYLSFSK